jgi:trimethylamine--corrinoid protein Co-methyltransferase
VDPVLRRLNQQQVELIHRLSLEMLEEPGLLVFNREAAELLGAAGARVKPTEGFAFPAWWVHISEKLVNRALESAPRRVRLGAREESNILELDADQPRVYFGSGSETNLWLEIQPEVFVAKDDPAREIIYPTVRRRRGTVADLARAAHLAEQLDNLDFFLRPVNIQDEDIDEDNKDVNKFFACLNYTTKHVMAGLTSLGQLDPVIKMAEIIAGGPRELRKNPLISFVTCVVKSPLQLVDDSTQKMLEMVRRDIPVVISSSPQGGSTAPIEEVGMVAQINAEILAGIVLSQLARPGAPVLYGSVPVRARMDTLHDMYGVPEFGHYNVDCVQMARFYGLPCYSTAGVADARIPGIQATAEKMLSYGYITPSGPALIHYAFGLLEETQAFCPEQAILDNWHIGMIKELWRQPEVTEETGAQVLDTVRRVMASSHRLYARYTRRLVHQGKVFPTYPFSSQGLTDEALLRAHQQLHTYLARPPRCLPREICREIFARVPGILPRLNPYTKEAVLPAPEPEVLREADRQ